jgi:type IV secretion system protein VirD4
VDKNRDIRHSLFILFCLFCFIVGTIYVVILSRALADYKFMAGDRIKFNSLYVSFQSLLSYKKQQNIFCVFESILALIVFLYIYFVVARPKKFESDVVKITPTISIPSPAGQGQFGSKWFLENIHETTYKKQKFSDWWFKRKRKEVFAHNNINFNNPFIKNLIDTGDEDIKDKINKLNNGVSITEIENAREKKLVQEQKENSEKEWITQFGNNDVFESFESFNDTEFEENFDLLEATNNTLDINEFENDIETANDLLVKKYADEIARKNEED